MFAAARALTLKGVHADADCSNRSVSKRVREGQVLQYNLICVIGDAELQNGTVSVRFRDDVTQKLFARRDPRFAPTGAEPGAMATLPVAELVEICQSLSESFET